ncbi:MAG: adenylate kinase [Saprospirales bacterium]|nr:MAG: adenylate kinase [Saprospirales bacterium]
MKNIILFGPPGSGKGTQAEKLAEKFNLLHISTGDMFRYEIKHDTPLGKKAKSYMDKGELVPDEVTIEMLRERVKKATGVDGIIFDGFPRNKAQAAALDELMDDLESPISGLILLDVSEDEIVKRILKRGESSGRADDKDESIIRNRIHVFRKQTAPVFAHYDQKGLAVKVNGLGGIDEIASRLSNAVEKL